MDLNFFSAVHSNQVVLPKMIARGTGYVVNTASFAGLYPDAANRIPYVACQGRRHRDVGIAGALSAAPRGLA
jgi:NADP-dependent 3-hydroxy acid dehydrogenase YdfG